MAKTKKPFNPYATYKTDENLEIEGVWLEEPYFRVRIRRAGGKNVAFQKVQARVMKPVRRLAEKGQLPEDLATQKVAETVSEAIVVSWQSREDPEEDNWQDLIFDPDQGQLVEIDKDVIRRALLAAPEFLAHVVTSMTNTNLFREDIEDDLKN